jgi:ethanolamine utilization protein EutN
MLLARVEGNVVATRKHPSLDGWRLVVCQPIDNGGEAEGAPLISSDGSEARKAVRDPKSPVRWLVVGIVDEKEPGVPV